MKDTDEWRKQRNEHRNNNPATLMSTQGYQTNLTFLGAASIADVQGFVGPSATEVDKHATGHVVLVD